MLGLAQSSLSTSALDLVQALFILAGCVTAACALYVMLMGIAALFHRASGATSRPASRLLVLVPAHDESDLIARCVGSLLAQSYPRHLYAVAVVADNCTDDTAGTASAAGADRVLIRDEPAARGKGRALRWAMDRLLADAPPADAVVVVDADSVADPNFLARLVAPFENGALAVQGESLLYPNDSPGSALRAAAFLLINRVRPAGRAVLGLAATHLAGNGMLLARDLLVAKPWGAFTSAEDVEYSLHLQMDGIRVAFARGAILHSPAAPTAEAAAQQQLRWEGGKAHLARTWLPRLVRGAVTQRRPALLGVAFDLVLPPLGFLAAAALAGGLAAGCLVLLAAWPVGTLTPWLVAAAAIAVFVLVGLYAGDAPRSAYAALLRAPLFVIRKPLQARRVIRFRGDTWIRTERRAEREVSGQA